MAKSSINFQKATSHSHDHNFRKDKPNYLLPKEFQKENEYWNLFPKIETDSFEKLYEHLKNSHDENSKIDEIIFNQELKKAKRKGGRIPKLENSRWEAVLNLNSSHRLDDVKKVAEHIEKKFNIICTSIALHRDEGFLENEKPQESILSLEICQSYKPKSRKF